MYVSFLILFFFLVRHKAFPDTGSSPMLIGETAYVCLVFGDFVFFFDSVAGLNLGDTVKPDNSS